jgi:multicomponent K+:H+ antiporter subunit G
MEMNPVVEFLIAALLVVGGLFVLVGAIGLVRFADFFMRLHAPT